MGYKSKVKERIDLSDLGSDSAGNPFFVEIKNPKMMNYDEKMSFVKFARMGNGDIDSELLQEMKCVIGGFILSWNLISIEDESVLPIPKQDMVVIDKVPSEVIESIMQSFANKARAVDQETKNSSAQLGKPSEADQLQETSTSAGTTN